MDLNIFELKDTIKKLTTPPKGFLAADESESNINSKFAPLNIENTASNRLLYRTILFTTKDIEKWFGGIILHEETFFQDIEGIQIPKYLKTRDIIPGIKVDKGLQDFNSLEKTTLGLDDLLERTKQFYNEGARFAKWRAVYNISENTPSIDILKKNAELLAQYSKICLENGLVPIVEPEVLGEGQHSINQCFSVTTNVLKHVFQALEKAKVPTNLILLKPNMVHAGFGAANKSGIEEIVRETLSCLKANVPDTVPGIFFLSGGQTEQEVIYNLNNMVTLESLPWRLSFSYGRALQNRAIKVWAGRHNNIQDAQNKFFEVAKANAMASIGSYKRDN